MIRLKGKSAIITGGARGIGLATAHRLAAEGVGVTLWDIDLEGLRSAQAGLRALDRDVRVRIERCDITDAEAVSQAAARAEEEFGAADILVNNAGYLAPGTLLDQPLELWHKTVDVNLNAVITVTREILPRMYARNSGHVVNISSAAATVGVAGLAVYSATKWAVWGLTESLRHEARNLGKAGVRFSSIHPIFLREGMFAGARLKGIGALLVPNVKNHDVIAKAVVDSALKRGRRCVMRPRTVRLAVLLRGILPAGVFDAAARALGVSRGMESWHGPREV